jgi:hypothetical protein
MPYDTDYGVCKFCGAKRVQNPKTGKVFCSEKCWLKKPTVERNLPPQGGCNHEMEIDALEAKTNAMTQKLNDLQYAQHALWAVLIQGDKEKEKQYELHKIPLVAKSKVEPTPEEETKFDMPF